MTKAKPHCEVCGFDELHADYAECMLRLMKYVLPDLQATDKFKRVVLAGYHAMKQELGEPIKEKKVGKKKKKSSAGVWGLQITYDLDSSYYSVDQKIEKLLRKEAVSSGAGFGKRDLLYTYSSKERAVEARKILKSKFRDLMTCEITPQS